MAGSPCVKVCKIENGACVGCGRTLEEIAQWSKMSNAERQRVLDRLAAASAVSAAAKPVSLDI